MRDMIIKESPHNMRSIRSQTMKPNLSHETIIDRLSTFFDGSHTDVVCVYLYGSVAIKTRLQAA